MAYRRHTRRRRPVPYDDQRLLGDLGDSYADLVNLARGAGCSGSAAQTAAAIAMAESSGNPSAHNPTPPDDSYGLWQINMLGKLGPARRAAFGLATNAALYDPATNARAMVSISGGCSNWRPWTTYTSGAYRQFLQAAPAPGPASGPGAPGETSAPAPEGGALSIPRPVLIAGALLLLIIVAK
jgi:hypothetical protein